MPGGDFEDLEQMVGSGWRHFQQSSPGIESDVSLTASAPREGRHALRIRAFRVEVNAWGRAVENTPVWINSATIAVPAGQLIRIHLWVRIDKPLVDSLDGLMIFDSLGGPLLARRIRQTQGWQDVTFFRKATRPHPLVVTFALTGIGDVAIDELVVQPLGSPRATISSPPSQTAVGRQPKFSTDRARRGMMTAPPTAKPVEAIAKARPRRLRNQLPTASVPGVSVPA